MWLVVVTSAGVQAVAGSDGVNTVALSWLSAGLFMDVFEEKTFAGGVSGCGEGVVPRGWEGNVVAGVCGTKVPGV